MLVLLEEMVEFVINSFTLCAGAALPLRAEVSMCVKLLLHVARRDTWNSKQAGTLMQQQKF